MSVQELIAVLDEIEACAEIVPGEDLIECQEETVPYLLVLEATQLAERVLLVSTEDGGRNYEAEDALMREGGYRVVTVEEEDSPWSLGGIETAKGVVLYA
jgi:hypothetical protein